jgi:hypothetical protein
MSVEHGISENKYRSWYNNDGILQLQHLVEGKIYAELFDDYTSAHCEGT